MLTFLRKGPEAALGRLPLSLRWGAFGVSLLLLLAFNAWLAIQSSRQVFDDQEKVRFGMRVEARVNTLLSLAKDVEAGTRGYLLTGQPEFLTPYDQAVNGLGTQISLLGQEIEAFPENHDSAQQLFAAITRVLDLADECIVARRQSGFDATAMAPLLARQNDGMDQLRNSANALRDRQSAIIVGFSRTLETTRRQAQVAILVPSLLSMLLAGLLWSLIVRDLRRAERHAQQRELLLAQERAARTEAEAASQAKDDFVAAASHELRTPLQAILGWTQFMQRVVQDHRNTPVSEFASALGTVGRHAHALSGLVDELLDASSAISGVLVLNTARVDLAGIIDDTVELVRPAAQAKQIALELQIEQSPLWLIGDANRLRQIVLNVLGNAVKFTPAGGTVSVRASLGDGRLLLSVRDTGIGISVEAMPLIFQRYFQGSVSTTRRHGGLGLGLAIVKHLVEMHGGQIEAFSEGLDRGAEFRLGFPVQALAMSEPRPAPGPAEQARAFSASAQRHADMQRLRGLRMVVVDDDPDVRTVLELLLAEEGATVTAAASAAEALEHLRRMEIDVVLSDIGMPDTDGYALARAVRALRSGESATPPTTPMIALTAFSRSEDERRALDSGFDAHVGKPIDVERLIAVLNAYASGKHTRHH